MQIYLIKELPGKGKAGDIINVNDGYGRNFVIKNGYGKIVDKSIQDQVNSKKESDAFHKNQEIAATRVVIEKLSQAKVTLSVKVGANGKLFGSVTGQEIAALLAKQGFNIDKKQLVFEQIKDLGTYKIKVKFAHSLEGAFNLEVINAN